MIGVNFQPGAQGQNGNGESRPSGGNGVQEAIKVLSLRLPKVVGAQASVPMPLLTSQGSGGNRVDSVVNQVLSRIMPGQQMQPLQSPAPSGPSFSGEAMYGSQPMTPSWPMPQQQEQPRYPSPHIVVDSPMGQPLRWPGQAQVDGGGGMFNGLIAPFPDLPMQQPPSLPNITEPLFKRPSQDYQNPSDREDYRI